MSAKNDITGDPIVSKPVTASYRDNYDSIFGEKKLQKLPNFDEVKANYTNIGTANSIKIIKPEGSQWRRCHRTRSGYEAYCCDEWQVWYDIYTD
jgi:hypothetical protein